MEKLEIVLIDLHDQIDNDRRNLIDFLREIDHLYPNDPIPAYTKRLYLNYIYLSELSCSIKEYFASRNLIIHKL
jgi:hypothetical protein